jgi:hypothetical protein
MSLILKANKNYPLLSSSFLLISSIKTTQDVRLIGVMTFESKFAHNFFLVHSYYPWFTQRLLADSPWLQIIITIVMLILLRH